MKQTLLLTAFSVLSGSAFAATSYNFESQANEDLFSGAVVGWTQTPNNPFITFPGDPAPTEVGLAFISDDLTPGVNKSAFLGTLAANLPTTSSVVISGDISDAGAFSGQQVTIDIGLVSEAAVRDSFGVNFTGSTSTVASLFFTPNADPDLWDVSYLVSGGLSVSTGITIETGANYTFFTQFTDGTITFGYSAGGVTTPFAIAVTGAAAGESFDEIQIVHTPNPGEPVGESVNAIVFDNISVGAIPEPTSAMLMGVAALGMLRRRRA